MGKPLGDPSRLLLTGVVQRDAGKAPSEKTVRVGTRSSVPDQEHRCHVGSVVAPMLAHNVHMIRGLGVYDPESAQVFRDPIQAQDFSELCDLTRRLHAEVAERDGAFVWLGMFEPTQSEMEAVAGIFDLHGLQIDDAMNTGHRPEFDDSGERHVLAIMKVLDYVDASSDVLTGQLAVFAGEKYVVTIRFGDTSDLGSVRERLADDEGFRRLGPIGVLHALMDFVVDGYLLVMDEIETDIEELEAFVFAPGPAVTTPERLYRLKRENVEIRRAVAPLAAMAHDFIHERRPWMPESQRAGFRDVGEHILRTVEAVEWADNLLMTLLTAATQLQDLQQNRDMRKISAWVAIAAVPTLMAGIYGMNFQEMPELRQPWGYPVVLGAMAVACALLFRAFKRSGWL